MGLEVLLAMCHEREDEGDEEQGLGSIDSKGVEQILNRSGRRVRETGGPRARAEVVTAGLDLGHQTLGKTVPPKMGGCGTPFLD